MRIDEAFYFIIKESHERIFIDRTVIDKITNGGVNPILWCRNGLFCMIPKEVVQNAMNNCEMFQQTDLKLTSPVLFFSWDQGTPISNQVGRALINE